MPRISAAEAGRKGGRSRSEKKLAACRRNGFQKISAPDIEQASALVSGPAPVIPPPVRPLIVAAQLKERA